MGVWVVALLLTLIFRREWLKKYNYWLSSALFVLAISGALSFFRPFDGWLAWFNLYGIFSLGGEIGDMVIGSPSFFGGVRLAIVVLAAAAVALPMWSKLVSQATARGAVFLYVTLFMGVKSLLFRGDLPKVDTDEAQSPAAGSGATIWPSPVCRTGTDSAPGEKTGAPRPSDRVEPISPPRTLPAAYPRLYRLSTKTVDLPRRILPTHTQMGTRGNRTTTLMAIQSQPGTRANPGHARSRWSRLHRLPAKGQQVLGGRHR